MLVVRAGPAQTGQRQMDPWQIGFLRQSPVQHGLGPVMLANARLSARSARGYAKLGALVCPAFSALSGVVAQTQGDADRLLQLAAVRFPT